MDTVTHQHLDKYIHSYITESHQESFRTYAESAYDDDADYWGRLGWAKLYEEFLSIGI